MTLDIWYETVIPVATLATHLHDPSWVVVDCRFDLAAPDAGEAAYLDGHIPGARYAHLDRDLSSRPETDRGRHPLPSPQSMARLFARLGIGDRTQVVAYDDTSGIESYEYLWANTPDTEMNLYGANYISDEPHITSGYKENGIWYLHLFTWDKAGNHALKEEFPYLLYGVGGFHLENRCRHDVRDGVAVENSIRESLGLVLCGVAPVLRSQEKGRRRLLGVLFVGKYQRLPNQLRGVEFLFTCP